MVELQPSKLVVRVRFPSPALLGRARFRWWEPVSAVGTCRVAHGRLQSIRGLPRDGTQAQTIDVLDSFREALRTQRRYADEDIVMDVMDVVVGWVSPHAKLKFA